MSTKISEFVGVTSVDDTALLNVVQNNQNFKIPQSDYVAGLGVTGTIVQDGPVTAVPVLDVQGLVNNIRNLVAGTGIDISVGPENGIIIKLSSALGLPAQNIIQVSLFPYTMTGLEDVIICTGSGDINMIAVSTAIKSVGVVSKTGTITMVPNGSETIQQSIITAGNALDTVPDIGGWVSL